MAKKPQTMPAVQKEAPAPVPAFMQGNKTASMGNDASDRIIPRVKLLQKISPEIDTFNDARPGEFWHTLAEQSLGPSMLVVPILKLKSLVLWAPRGDDRGILARSNDTIHWQTPNLKFRVRPKGSPSEIEYDLKGSVAESGLAEFGSSIPGDSNSAPAASLTYNLMFYAVDFPELSPFMVINTRSAVKAAKNLLAKIDMREGNHYGQIFRMGITDEGTTTEPYFGYSYTAEGYLQDEELYNRLGQMFEDFSSATNWKVNEENSDEDDKSPAQSARQGDKTGRGGAF